MISITTGLKMLKIKKMKPTKEELQKWFRTYLSMQTIGEDEQGNDVLMKEDDRLIDEICSLNEIAMQEFAEAFHKEKLREELMKYDLYHGNDIFQIEKWVDEYLKQKEY